MKKKICKMLSVAIIGIVMVIVGLYATTSDQEEEVSEVIWMDYEECKKGIQENTIKNCIYLDEFELIGKGLGIDG